MKTTKKLIEVALPLEAINTASAREKSIRHGHPSTLHLWWARRPLAAARAVIFAQMVDDPSTYIDTLRSDPKLKRKAESVLKGRLKVWNEARELERKAEGTKLDVPEPGPEPTLDAILADLERQRLFAIIEDLVKWENTTNETVLQAAREEIWQSWRRACAENADHPRAKELFDRNKLPAFHDPFAGGGALPLEAQRLGLESYASDLNPVAVLINKAMIEIPPRFAGRPPVNPRSRSEGREERSEGREERSERANALSRDDRLAEGNGSDPRGLPSGSASSAGGNIRDEIAADTINGLGSGQYRGRMDPRDDSGQGALPGNSPGLARGSGDLADTLRAARLVSSKRDHASEESHGRGQPDADSDASQPQGVISQSSLPFTHSYRGAQGLAEDVRYYGKWMRDEAEKRIGHLYPKVEVTAEMAKDRPDLKPYVGQELTVIAWLWARTVKSPNPAFAQVDVPLASTFMLSTKAGKEAYVEPVIEDGGYRFTVKVGKPVDAERAKNGTKLSRGANFECLMSKTPIASEHIYGEANAGRMGARLMAIVAEGARGRVYLAPTAEHEAVALKAKPEWKPEVAMPENPRWFSPPLYGLKTYGDLFTPRQLVALTTFSDLVQEAREQVYRDAMEGRAGGPHTQEEIKASGLGARASGPHAPDSSPLPDHQGWHSRGYHPHFDRPGLLQSINFRLHDSVPASLLEQWREELRLSDPASEQSEEAEELRRRIEEYEDRGHGQCYLRDPRVAELVENAFLHFDGDRYRLLDWCVMPNHVHVLIETREGHPLASVVRSWKSFTAREANLLLGREGAFWMPDYYDRFIRDEAHLNAVRRYIRNNPVKAGLCATAEEWPWGSARRMRAGGPRTQDAPLDHSPHDAKPLRDGGTGALAYAEAVGVYLGLGVDRLSDRSSTICGWDSGFTKIRNTFGRQAIPMTWDYAEGNPFSDSTGNFSALLEWVEKFLIESPAKPMGLAAQQDASVQSISTNKLVSTDPPYYDNIGYADLSDFFYVWLRRSLRPVFPDLFATLAVPKAEELVATPYRHGSKEKAETFFLDGMTEAMHRLAEQSHPAFPVTIYYAFKQSETLGARASGPHDVTQTTNYQVTTSTGWETFLDAVIRAGFGISGTWPMRTELSNRMIGKDTNALASSIVLVCRKRPATAPTATRREFVAALKAELPAALTDLQRGNIAPVDLAQAAIGPGMAVYTRYTKVLDAEGRTLSVRESLALINETLDEALASQEGDFDADSRWALTWFDQHGFDEGEYGTAEQLSKSKNTSVAGMVEAGILESKRGKVRLYRPEELPADWDPATDPRLTAWEVVHQLIRVVATGGEPAAAALVAKLGAKAEVARELAYRLYTACERKKRNSEALAYNGLVQSWPEIVRLSREGAAALPAQTSFLETDEE